MAMRRSRRVGVIRLSELARGTRAGVECEVN